MSGDPACWADHHGAGAAAQTAERSAQRRVAIRLVPDPATWVAVASV